MQSPNQIIQDMSGNNSKKFNANSTAFCPTKKEQRLASNNMASQVSTDQRPRDGHNGKKSKQKFIKIPQSDPNRKWSSEESKKSFDLPHDRFEEELLAGKTRPTSRRGQISINHLLDFQFEHEERAQPSYYQRKTNRRRKSGLGPRVHLTGERYINVNYKFVVDHRGDYRPQILDTNIPINRQYILRVIIPKNDTQCPICLTDDLVAPRMTSCGHSFCFVCLLRYLDSEDPVPPKKNEPVRSALKLKECPLCSKKIRPEETLPVLINPIDERYDFPKAGEDAILQLMYRPHSKILSIPYQMRLRNPDIYSGNIPWFSTSNSSGFNSNELNITGNDLFQYSRVMKAGSSFVVDKYAQEIRDIKQALLEDQAMYDETGEFHDKAIKEIETIVARTETDDLSSNFSNISLHENSEVGSDMPLTELENLQRTQTEFNDANTFFFYQTSFNSKIKFFVSSLDTKILKALYGAYSNFPLCINQRIENIAYDFVVNDELIKRYKFLNFLPHGTEVAFLELDWFEEGKGRGKNAGYKNKVSILPPAIYDQFKKDLLSRSERTRSKAVREDRLKLRYEDELEWKTRNFFANENNISVDDYGLVPHNNFEALLSEEDSSMPVTGSTDDAVHELTNSNPDGGVKYETTVWGTRIAKKEQDHGTAGDDSEDDYFNELLRQSKEKEERKKSKKGKKKLVLLTTRNE